MKSTHSLAGFALLGLLLLSGCVASQTQSTNTIQEQNQFLSTTSGIRGESVIEDCPGVAMEGKVNACTKSAFNATILVKNNSEEIIARAESDGNYQIGLPVGTYHLEAIPGLGSTCSQVPKYSDVSVAENEYTMLNIQCTILRP